MAGDEGMPPGPGPASARVAELCRRLLTRPDLRGEPEHSELADCVTQCSEPLRVAVTGDVSSGKSTLINALLGDVVAEVQRRETTAVVTWFRHPALQEPPPMRTNHRMCARRFPLADRIVLADTPGVNTVSGNQHATEEMVSGSTAAAGSATVLLYLFADGEVSAGAKHRLSQFAGLTAGDFGSGFNIVLVGGKADALSASPEEIEDNLVAGAGLLGATAVAVRQQLAVAARCRTISDRDAATISAIAADDRLLAAARFGWDDLIDQWQSDGGDPADIIAVAEATGAPFGVVAAAEHVRQRGPGSLADLWLGMSRLNVLESLLSSLAKQSDVLTVNAAVGRLRRLATRLGPERGQEITSSLTEVMRHPVFEHLQRLAGALLIESSLTRNLPDTQRADAAQVLRRGTPHAPPDEVARYWTRLANQPGRSTVFRQTAQLVAEAADEATRLGSTAPLF